MRYLRLALLPLVFAACTERAPIAPIDDGPAFSWMNNPDNGNLRIYRYESDFAISWTDAKTGLRATHTTYPIGAEPDCGPQGLLDPIAAQDVGLEDVDDFLASWFHSQAQGDVWLIVRDVNQAGDCYNNLLVGQGTANIRYTDNDVFAWYPAWQDPPTGEPALRQNNNSYGFMANGSVTTVDGEVLRYSGHLRIVWDPQAGKTYTETAKVNVH
jgi:hypothetical protein